jgi:hypothetical protein
MKREDGAAMSSAHEELLGELEPGETIEAIVFGPWGWGVEEWEPGYGEPKIPPVPFSARGHLLQWEEAEPYMTGWSFYGGFGSPSCYAICVWTNRRVGQVHEYDGSTRLTWVPRNPIAHIPKLT